MTDQPSFVQQLMQRRVVRVLGMYLAASFVLLQVMDVTFEPLGFPEWSHTFVIIILLLGLPVVGVLAWVFDVTPAGVVVAGEALPVYTRRAKLIDRSIIAVLVVAVVVLGSRDWLATDAPVAGDATLDRSVAILPLRSLSGSEADGYFAAGLAEQITTSLARIPDLRVIAHSSSSQLATTERSLGQLADVLNVAHLLQGSVRKSGSDLRVALQLVRAADGDVLWSNTFEQQMKDVFAIQDRVAEAVAMSLQSALYREALGRRAAERTDSVEAYEAYLLGLHYRGDSWLMVTRYAQRAIELDPDFVPAHVLLAENYTRRVGGTMPAAQAFPAARASLETALSMAPEYVPALIVRGKLERISGDYRAAEQTLRRAKSLAPGESTLDLANLLFMLGRLDEALPEYEHSALIDPLWNGWYAAALLANGSPEKAISVMESALPALSERWQSTAIADLARTHAFLGNRAAAGRLVDEALQIVDPNIHYSRGNLAYALARIGRQAEALAIVEDLEARRQRQYVSPAALFTAYLGLRDLDRAFEWLNAAVDEHVLIVLVAVTASPWLDELRDDPRFDAVLDRLGLYAES